MNRILNFLKRYGSGEMEKRSAAAAAKSLQSWLTLCDPIDSSPPGSPSLGFSSQEHWSGLPFPSPIHESEKWKWSHLRLLATPWTTAYQAPPSMGFSRQEYWSGLPLPSPRRSTEGAFKYRWQIKSLMTLIKTSAFNKVPFRIEVRKRDHLTFVVI